MTSNIAEPQLLKADRRGRVRVPKERQEALLAEFARSGVSGAEFARLTGVNYATFIGWVAKERRRTAEAPVVEPPAERAVAGVQVQVREPRPAVRLFEAVAGAPERALASCPLQIDLPGGARLQLAESAHVPWAAELLQTLWGRGVRAC